MLGTNLVLVGGHAGSGKTTFSRILAQKSSYALLDKDVVTRPLVDALAEILCGNPNDRQSDIYKKIIRPLEYKVLLGTAYNMGRYGTNVIVDAPFISELLDQDNCLDLQTACINYDINLKIIWIMVQPEVLKERIFSRNVPRDEWKINNWEEFERTLSPNSPCMDYFLIDNSDKTIEDLNVIAQTFVNNNLGY